MRTEIIIKLNIKEDFPYISQIILKKISISGILVNSFNNSIKYSILLRI